MAQQLPEDCHKGQDFLLPCCSEGRNPIKTKMLLGIPFSLVWIQPSSSRGPPTAYSLHYWMTIMHRLAQQSTSARQKTGR